MAVVPTVSYTRHSLMHFIDEYSLDVEAGNGGNGAIAFRREKSMPLDGPAGGDGGRGGNVIIVADPGLDELMQQVSREISS